MQKTEGPRRGDLGQVVPIREIHPEGLFSDQGMREIDGIRDGISIGRIHRDKLVPFPQLQLAADAQIGPRTPLFANAGLLYDFHKGQRAAVEDGQLQVVEFDDGVVDAQPIRAESRCSVVEMSTPFFIKLVA